MSDTTERDRLAGARESGQCSFDHIREMVETLQDARDPADPTPIEYRILLCTGGPAVQIIGELSEHGEPETARLQVQDWFQPWTNFRPSWFKEPHIVALEDDTTKVLLDYAQCFYFGG